MAQPIQYTNHAYEVVAYSPSWPTWYNSEAGTLKDIFGDAALKVNLYKEYPNDYLKYREFKDPYIEALKGRIQQVLSQNYF